MKAKMKSKKWRKEFKGVRQYVRFGILSGFLADVKSRQSSHKFKNSMPDLSDIFDKWCGEVESLLAEQEREFKKTLKEAINEGTDYCELNAYEVNKRILKGIERNHNHNTLLDIMQEIMFIRGNLKRNKLLKKYNIKDEK